MCSSDLITTAEAPTHGLDVIRSHTSTVDLADALAQLDAEIVHAEGGPTLNAALAAADLVDEINLTIAPHLVGGSGKRIVAPNDVEQLKTLDLVHVATDESFLFLRYARGGHFGSNTR